MPRTPLMHAAHVILNLQDAPREPRTLNLNTLVFRHLLQATVVICSKCIP